MSAITAGIPWYRREDWDALRRLFSDAHSLHDAYDDWLASAENIVAQLKAEGVAVEKILLEPHTFASWCAERKIAPDAQARSRFASESARRIGQERD